MKGGANSFQCGVVGTGRAAVFSGGGRRALTTVDVNTTRAHLLQFHFLAGTVSDVCMSVSDVFIYIINMYYYYYYYRY